MLEFTFLTVAYLQNSLLTLEKVAFIARGEGIKVKQNLKPKIYVERNRDDTNSRSSVIRSER